MATTALLHARVAVIDDDRMVREMLELGLSREGYEVRTAADGFAALELVRRFDPEVIVLDIMMPKIDGITLLPMLREITQAPILMLTAKGGTDDKVQTLTAGADDYLVKPFVFEELIARLQAKLRRPQLIEENVLRWRDVALNPATREACAGKDGSSSRSASSTCFRFSCASRGASSAKIICSRSCGDTTSKAGRTSSRPTFRILRAKIDRPGEPGSFIRTVRGCRLRPLAA